MKIAEMRDRGTINLQPGISEEADNRSADFEASYMREDNTWMFFDVISPGHGAFLRFEDGQFPSPERILSSCINRPSRGYCTLNRNGAHVTVDPYSRRKVDRVMDPQDLVSFPPTLLGGHALPLEHD